MYHPQYDTEAMIKLHQQDLLHQAERDRLLSAAGRTHSSAPRRLLAATGKWLVVIGSRLQSRYGDAPASVALAAAPKSSA
jgi:hypothetical protein